METHLSWIILTGHYAYKVKKPVNFGFVDFSTLNLRRFFCQEELRLNRRFTTDLYLSVVAIDGPEDEARIDGRGTPIEYALKMHQFGQHQLFESLLANDALSDAYIDRFAEQLAVFHLATRRAGADDPWGTPQTIGAATRENFDHLLSAATEPRERTQLRALCEWHELQSRDLWDLLEDRRRTGFVRECHGDLHLGNLVLIADRPTAFDCIEFNENLRWIDVVSEIAFLGMDLQVSGATALAYRFLNRYETIFGDYEGLRLWNFYRLYRAMVRAKVSRLTMRQTPDPGRRSLLRQRYQRYLDFGTGLVKQKPPRLIITHGLSGSGKSHLAAALSEHLPAVWLRSDIERKRIIDSKSVDEAYSADTTRKTYTRLRDLASILIKAGLSVIVDATFLLRRQREQQLELARETGVDFSIIEIDAPLDVLKERIERRESIGTDPSEATNAILMNQIRRREALSDPEKMHVRRVDGQSPNIALLASDIESGSPPSR